MLIETLTARFGGPLLKMAIPALLVAVGGLGAWRAMAAHERMVEASFAQGEQQERHRWQAEIAASNAKIAEAQLAAERSARAASDRAAAEIAVLRQSLADLERANAALPNADACGLDRDRVRLLRQQSGGARDPQR